MAQTKTFRPRQLGASLCFLLVITTDLFAGVVVREPIEPGVFATVKHGRLLGLECHPPKGDGARTLLQKYLADEDKWRDYADLRSAAIAFRNLKPDAQRTVLLTVFPNDTVDEQGWWHEVRFGGGEEGQEFLWSLCEWLTGRGTCYEAVMRTNHLSGTALRRGQKILIPADLLRDGMKKFTPASPSDAPEDLEAARSELTYGRDKQGDYAVYRLKPGEALYTAVVVRFTDFRENTDILKTCETIRKRSGIRNVHAMKPGQRVLIPLEMLSDRFGPEGSPGRKRYEEAIREARRLKGQVRSRDLEGVVVVLDPGHGGRDHGAPNPRFGLYEDELNYDIGCRIKHLLETKTRAKVYMTLLDRSQGCSALDLSRFTHDTDEELLTTPTRYKNANIKNGDRISANLRAYIANSIFQRETKNGTDERKVVFTSIHCDALFNEKLRGAMVYIPGAEHRRLAETPKGSDYDRYNEAKWQREVRTTLSERKRDEALSRNFAETLLEELGKHRIKRHKHSDPVRSAIRQSGGDVYVPAVLRINKIPTKVLVEAANMTNETDCARLADPWWRQQFAMAYVSALKVHFGSH